MARILKKEKLPVPAARAGRARSKPTEQEGSVPEAALQARLVEAQAAMERDYARLREFESRLRHLFTTTTEALLVVEGQTLRVLDVNPVACALLGMSAQKIVGASALSLFQTRSQGALEALAADMLRGGRPGNIRVDAVAGSRRLALSASVFRQDGAFVLLLRLEPPDARTARGERVDASDDWARYCAGAPDAIVLTDMSGKILQANPAFVELVQVATERQVRGESLGRWLGRTSVDLGVLITNLRQRGSLKLFATNLRSEHGALTEVEISAAQVTLDEDSCLGFTIRDVGRRLVGDTHSHGALSKSVGQLAELVGRVPMREIVANTAALIEKMCIEAALQLTRNNRAAAAELLGLSRQSLYVKLRRYGLGDVDSEVVGRA